MVDFNFTAICTMLKEVKLARVVNFIINFSLRAARRRDLLTGGRTFALLPSLDVSLGSEVTLP